LRTELADLYAGLFEKADRHEAVVRALAARRRGMTRPQLLAVTGLGSGGALTKVLDELEQCGFVMQMPRLGHKKREAVYWLADHFSLFFLKWTEHHRSGARGARRVATKARLAGRARVERARVRGRLSPPRRVDQTCARDRWCRDRRRCLGATAGGAAMVRRSIS